MSAEYLYCIKIRLTEKMNEKSSNTAPKSAEKVRCEKVNLKLMQKTEKNEIAMKTQVAIFTRVSLDRMDYNRQIDDLTIFANRMNYEVVEIISEKISGATENSQRSGIQELLEKAKAGKFQKVLCTEISRIGRTQKNVLDTIEQLTKLGISLYVQDMGLETLDKNGKPSFLSELMVNIMSLFAGRERETTIERIRSGMRRAKAMGVHVGRPVGTIEETETFLKKHSKAVKDLKDGLSVRKVCKLHDLAQGTVMKLRKAIGLYMAA